MQGNDFKFIGGIFEIGLWAIVIMFPLAIWKLIEIVIWLIKHVSISVL